jgi:lamin tail-like protein
MLSDIRKATYYFAFVGALSTTSAVPAQVLFTEVLHSPVGSDALWEWVEFVNAGSSPLDLDGWVFDDDDDGAIGGASGGANIAASSQNNTIVPAGGVAVLYPADELDFMPERFTSAWGSGITLIGVNGLTSLSQADAIGLWPSRASYDADTIPDVTVSPRRTFANAVASFDYSAAPVPENGHSVAWNGVGSPTNSENWVASVENQLGAFASQQTSIENSQINSTADRGNPGLLPTGAASAGLRITEIMFAPDSPLVAVGYQEADFEWIEVLNNTPNVINFANTPHVFDDTAGSKLDAGNIRGGMIAAGNTGILFNSEQISIEQMQAMWGSALTYIPVENWPSLNNTGGDTIALWDSYGDYNSEAMTGSPRTYANAIAAVTYNTVAGQGWPTILSGRSIWLDDLSGDPNVGENWTRAGATGDNLSFQAAAIFEMAIDHPGGDVGSPGFVPGEVTPTLPGDYNADGAVDAADYVVWRTNDGPLEDYNTWRANFGRTAASASATSAAVPEPEATLIVVGLSAIFLMRQRARINS